MALQPQATLEEMTADVLSAVGEGGDGVASAATEAMVQSLIRRANKQVQDDSGWTISRFTVTVNLPANETTFDWPDDSEPGNINFIKAQRASDAQYIWDLVAGITTMDRSQWLNTAALNAYSYAPSKYDFLNGVIEVGPPCVEDITLTIEAQTGPALLIDPGDRPNCDALAIVMQAEILFRNARGGDFRAAIPKLESDYRKWVITQKAKQGTKQAFVPGRRWNLEDPARRWDDRPQRHWMWRDVRP